MNWLKDFPSTPARAVVSLGLASVYVVTALAADIVGHPISEATLGAVSFFIFGLLSSDVAAFGLKRYSDRELAKAKAQGPSPVTVEAPSDVTVTGSDATIDPGERQRR